MFKVAAALLLVLYFTSQQGAEGAEYEKAADEIMKMYAAYEKGIFDALAKVNPTDQGAAEEAKKVVGPASADAKKMFETIAEDAKKKTLTVDQASTQFEEMHKMIANIQSALLAGPLGKLKPEALQELQAIQAASMQEVTTHEKQVLGNLN